MFGLGFGEILLIAVVALIVLGPERLPKVAHSAGVWVGRIQNFINNVKLELNKQAAVAEFKQARDSFELAARSIEADINHNIDSLRHEVETVNREIMAAEHSNASSELCSSPSSNHFPSEIPLIHRVSLRRQALQRKRDMRPKHQLIPKLRVRRH
ncbi:Sec-independent protein secretion pathway component [Snodgrassella alvi SCGC AB-598-O02]|nr:Sec-independent protein translocase protein TatB [Snodgrassella alvi]KES10347.1 Sec-independent protein secretion pathway component [Snodgrassella alvi SCGC AB-598-O02]